MKDILISINTMVCLYEFMNFLVCSPTILIIKYYKVQNEYQPIFSQYHKINHLLYRNIITYM